MEKEQRRVTSADVARASGVSRATVSYVLNNDPRQSISPETRARVLEAAKALDYQPFAPARILRAGHSQIVLAILPFEMVDPAIARSLKDLEAELAVQGFSLIWHVGIPHPSDQMHPSANLTPAVIVSFADESEPAIAAFLRQFNVPIVAMSMKSGRQAVGRTQAAYLARQGWRHLVFAGPERRDLQKLAQARLEGVRQVCSELGLESPLIQVVPFSREGAARAMRALLARQAPPFGVCCYNDEVAFAVIAALSDLGLQLPEAVAVIGCDDIPLAQFSLPSLTTISFGDKQGLEVRVKNILAASRGEPLQEVAPIPPAVIVRESA
jgi:DNA-binding LacI/PurR family transcriptional regulator